MVCDYSGTSEPVIKGNIGSSGEKIYHTPDSPYYARTRIDESEEETWFCTEEEAIAAGWRAPLPGTATASPTPTATPTGPSPTATVTAAAGGQPDVRIRCIFFDGVVSRYEPDEYVEIVNLGDGAQELEGWRLVDISDEKPELVFPQWTMKPGDVVRVYTNQVRPEWGGFSFGRGTAVWSNDEPDTAGLYDETRSLVSTKSYPPGCE